VCVSFPVNLNTSSAPGKEKQRKGFGLVFVLSFEKWNYLILSN